MEQLSPITIQNRRIGPGHPCFIVAELSGNHHQRYEEAAELVKAAKEAGADAVKLQTYTPDTLTLNSDKKWFLVKGKEQPESWQKKNLYQLYQEGYTPWEWQPKLKELAESLGLILFSTPFDATAVDFLEKIDVPCYKVASYEAIHIPLLKKIAQTGKPVIMSIGFASQDEAELAIHTLRENGSTDIVVLHCVTAYSDTPRFEYTNLRTIMDIRERFRVISGFSDNNAGIKIPVIAAVVAGAKVIEKHFILDRSKGGVDARFSIEPKELAQMIKIIRKAEREGREVLREFVSEEEIQKALGQVHYGPASSQEQENTFFRPSIWVKKDVKKGDIFTTENIRVARPSAGLPPKFFEAVLGKRAAHNIEAATPLSWDLIEQ